AMKRPVLLFLVLCLSLWRHAATAQPGDPDDLTLIAYEANASVTLLLTETGNPQNIIEFAVEHSGSAYQNFPHPGNICFNDSPPTLLGNTARTLMSKMQARNPEQKSLSVRHFVIFIAGYDDCAKLLIGSQKKKDFYLGEVREQLALYNVQAPDLITLTGDDRLVVRAARESLEPDSIERIDDVNAIQLTTLTVGYEIRGGYPVTSKAPFVNKHGGDYQLGSIICEDHTSQAYRQREYSGQIYDPVACAINALPQVQAFNKANQEPFFSHYAKKYFVSDILFANVHGFLGFEVLRNNAPPGYNETFWQEGQNILKYYVTGQAEQKIGTYSLAHAALQVVERLEKEGQYPVLASGQLPPLHIFGEVPSSEVGLSGQLLKLMEAERAKRTRIYTQAEFHLAAAKGAQRYMGLFPSLMFYAPPALTPQTEDKEEVKDVPESTESREVSDAITDSGDEVTGSAEETPLGETASSDDKATEPGRETPKGEQTASDDELKELSIESPEGEQAASSDETIETGNEAPEGEQLASNTEDPSSDKASLKEEKSDENEDESAKSGNEETGKNVEL
ncbi:MAG: hypothetical protein ACR2PT_15315, partial [Endozoicomonas sp.]